MWITPRCAGAALACEAGLPRHANQTPCKPTPCKPTTRHPALAPRTRLWRALRLLLVPVFLVLLAAPAAAQAPVLSDVRISDVTAESGDRLELRYGAHVGGGLGRFVAVFSAENGAGLHIEAESPGAGLVPVDIRRGHLDGVYRLESVFLEAEGDSDNWAEYSRDGGLRTGQGDVPGGHELAFAAADFTVEGNGAIDTIAPELLWIMRDGAGSYRFVALDDGEGVVSVSVELLDPDGALTSAETRAPGNRGQASLRLMQGAPTGLYQVQGVTLRDGASPPNITTYHRDGSVTSGDPDAPQNHGFTLAALDFVYGQDRPAAPELDSIVHEGDGTFSFAASGPQDIARVELVVRRPDGSIALAAAEAPEGQGRMIVPLGGDFPQGQHMIEAVRLTDAADPPVTVEYRRDGTLHGAHLVAPERHDLYLWTLDFAWWGGPLPSETELTLPERIVLDRGDIAQVRVSSVHGIPQGWVHLYEDDESLVAAELDAEGVARLPLDDLEPGTYRLEARYSGSDAFQASASEVQRVTVVADPGTIPGFVGGGVVFGLSESCEPALGLQPHAVTVRYSPSELDRPPSGVTIAWAEGAEHLSLWGPMTPGRSFLGGAGRSTWGRFVFAGQRPLIRVVQQQVTEPENAQIERAQEVVLRLRVQNFGAVPGCAVTLAATLRRTG